MLPHLKSTKRHGKKHVSRNEPPAASSAASCPTTSSPTTATNTEDNLTKRARNLSAKGQKRRLPASVATLRPASPTDMRQTLRMRAKMASHYRTVCVVPLSPGPWMNVNGPPKMAPGTGSFHGRMVVLERSKKVTSKNQPGIVAKTVERTRSDKKNSERTLKIACK